MGEKFSEELKRKLLPNGEVKRIVLTNTQDGHNKFYVVRVISISNKFQVKSYWGKIQENIEYYKTNNLSSIPISQTQVKDEFKSQAMAESIARDLALEKTKKGYVEIYRK